MLFYTINSKHCDGVLCVSISIQNFQHYACVGCKIFMQDGAFSQNAKMAAQQAFWKRKNYQLSFSNYWSPRSPDINPYDCWLWGYLINVVFNGPIANTKWIEDRHYAKIHNVTTDTFWCVVELGVSLFQLVAKNGQHIEHFLRTSLNN